MFCLVLKLLHCTWVESRILISCSHSTFKTVEYKQKILSKVITLHFPNYELCIPPTCSCCYIVPKLNFATFSSTNVRRTFGETWGSWSGSCRGVNSKHHAAERWDLEFGFQTPLKNLKTHWNIWKLTENSLKYFGEGNLLQSLPTPFLDLLTQVGLLSKVFSMSRTTNSSEAVLASSSSRATYEDIFAYNMSSLPGDATPCCPARPPVAGCPRPWWPEERFNIILSSAIFVIKYRW